MSKQRKDATIVTTLTVTHVLEGRYGGSEEELMGQLMGLAVDLSEEEIMRVAQDLARVAKDAAWAGYLEHCLPAGRPDDISVSGVQVFLHDEQSTRAEGGAE